MVIGFAEYSSAVDQREECIWSNNYKTENNKEHNITIAYTWNRRFVWSVAIFTNAIH